MEPRPNDMDGSGILGAGLRREVRQIVVVHAVTVSRFLGCEASPRQRMASGPCSVKEEGRDPNVVETVDGEEEAADGDDEGEQGEGIIVPVILKAL